MADEPNSLTEHERALIAGALEVERRKRRKVLLALAAAVLVLAVCGGAFAKWREQKQMIEAEKAAKQQVEREHAAEVERRADEAEEFARKMQMRKMVRDSLAMAAEARTPKEIRTAQELLDEAADLAQLVAPDLLPEVELGRRVLATAAQRAAPEMGPEFGAPVAPPPRAVNR